MSEVSYSARLEKDGVSLYPVETEVEQVLTEAPWSARVVLSKEDGDSVSLGDTLDVYLSVNGEEHKVLNGIVVKKTYQYPRDRGVPTCELTLVSRGGWYLTRSYYRSPLPTGPASIQLKYILEPLVPDTLSGLDVGYPSVDMPRAERKEGNYWSLVQELCESVDWDFYVDEGNTLRAFPRGYFVNSTKITGDLYELNLESDASEIITKQVVIGGPYSTIEIAPSELQTPNSIESTTYLGRDAVRIYDDSGTLKAVKFWSEPVDLSYARTLLLEFAYTTWEVESTEWLPNIAFRFRFYSDDENYFEREVTASGGRIQRDYSSGKQYYRYAGWSQLQVPLPFCAAGDWGIHSGLYTSPDWKNISSFSLEVVSPLGSWPELYLSTIRIVDSIRGTYSVSSSFGEVVGEPRYDEHLNTEEMCVNLASIIVETYKNPLESAGEVPTPYNFTYKLGERVTLDVLGYTKEYEVRRIRHEYSEGQLVTYLDLSTRYRPKLETLWKRNIDLLRKVSYDLEAYKRYLQDSGVLDTRGQLIGWDATDVTFAYEEWMDVHLVDLPFESKDGFLVEETNTPVYSWDVGAGGYLEIAASEIDWNEIVEIRGKQNVVSLNQETYFKTRVTAPSHTLTLLNVDVGHYDSSTFTTGVYVGFLLDATVKKVYGEARSNSGYSTLELGDFTLGQELELEWRHKDGVIKYYMNRQFKGQLEHSLPSTRVPCLKLVLQNDGSGVSSDTITVYGWKLAFKWRGE